MGLDPKPRFRVPDPSLNLTRYFFIPSQVPAATNALASGTEMTTDAQGSRVVLTADGSEPDRLSDLVHQVAYLNTREFPSPGKRIVQLATTLHCKYVYLRMIKKIPQKITLAFSIIAFGGN